MPLFEKEVKPDVSCDLDEWRHLPRHRKKDTKSLRRRTYNIAQMFVGVNTFAVSFLSTENRIQL